jgi:hypothetical protein
MYSVPEQWQRKLSDFSISISSLLISFTVKQALGVTWAQKERVMLEKGKKASHISIMPHPKLPREPHVSMSGELNIHTWMKWWPCTLLRCNFYRKYRQSEPNDGSSM